MNEKIDDLTVWEWCAIEEALEHAIQRNPSNVRLVELRNKIRGRGEGAR